MRTCCASTDTITGWAAILISHAHSILNFTARPQLCLLLPAMSTLCLTQEFYSKLNYPQSYLTELNRVKQEQTGYLGTDCNAASMLPFSTSSCSACCPGTRIPGLKTALKCMLWLQLFPYHLADYACRVLRVTPFRYYIDLLFLVMREEKSYDQIPNFTVGHSLLVLASDAVVCSCCIFSAIPTLRPCLAISKSTAKLDILKGRA